MGRPENKNLRGKGFATARLPPKRSDGQLAGGEKCDFRVSFVGELGPTYTRLQLGEIYVALSLTDSYVKQTGAPVAEAGVQLVVAPSYHVGLLKGAPHPHTAHLFAVFMTAPESQRIWEKPSA